MAEMEIQRKKRPIWPWVLGLALLIALVWIGAEMLGDDDAEDPYATAPAAVGDGVAIDSPMVAASADGSQAVQQFRSTCGTPAAFREDMDQSHAKVAQCVKALAGALSATVGRDTVGGAPLAQRLDTLRQKADRLTREAGSAQHANQLGAAMNEALQVMDRVAETRTDVSSELRTHISAMRTAANDFGRNELLLEQKRSAGSYFEHAAMALTLLNQNQGGRS